MTRPRREAPKGSHRLPYPFRVEHRRSLRSDLVAFADAMLRGGNLRTTPCRGSSRPRKLNPGPSNALLLMQPQFRVVAKSDNGDKA